MLNHFPSIHLSEEENDVSCRRELALLRAVLVSRSVVGVLKADFRPEQKRGSNPVPPTESRLASWRFSWLWDMLPHARRCNGTCSSARFKRNLRSPGGSSCRFCLPSSPTPPTSASPLATCP